jgi:1-aminocyclopropane-1-carboxylate deaminase/D-cysteine desulfhydrase-like pyridoxal-dependent ACC family enzyme
VLSNLPALLQRRGVNSSLRAPTPIEHLPRLTAHLGGDVQIYAKRDDCNSGLAYGIAGGPVWKPPSS